MMLVVISAVFFGCLILESLPFTEGERAYITSLVPENGVKNNDPIELYDGKDPVANGKWKVFIELDDDSKIEPEKKYTIRWRQTRGHEEDDDREVLTEHHKVLEGKDIRKQPPA